MSTHLEMHNTQQSLTMTLGKPSPAPEPITDREALRTFIRALARAAANADHAVQGQG